MGHLIPQIYLEKKGFDKVKIRTLSIDYKFKGIATEIYFAMKGEEYGFGEAARKFKSNYKCTTRWRLDEVEDMKPALKWAAQNAKIGSPCKP